jgi:flagellar protein FliS
MDKEKKQEFTVRITNANRSELVVILYDMTLVYIDEAKAFLKEGNQEQFREELKKAQDCVKELISALDKQYEIASELARLYLYVNRTLAKVMVKPEETLIVSAENVIKGLRESFEQVAKQDDSPALMGNAQEIYAGLTYGKNSLNENLSDEGASRGFFV